MHLAEVDVSNEAGLRCPGNVVLHQNGVFENADLRAIFALTNHHDTVNRLAPGKKFALGHNRAPTAHIAAIAATLLFGFQSSGATNALGLGNEFGFSRQTHFHYRARFVVAQRAIVTRALPLTPPQRTLLVKGIAVALPTVTCRCFGAR